MQPRAEELEHLSVFGRKFDVLILSFTPATVEGGVEESGVEAEDAFEDHEFSLIAAGSHVDLDVSIKRIARRVSMNWRAKYSVCIHLVGNLSGVDGGAIVAIVNGG